MKSNTGPAHPLFPSWLFIQYCLFAYWYLMKGGPLVLLPTGIFHFRPVNVFKFHGVLIFSLKNKFAIAGCHWHVDVLMSFLWSVDRFIYCAICL